MTRRAPASRHAPKKDAAVQDYELVLYVGGATENSRLALSNIKSIAEKHLKGRYRLAVVDLFQQPERARADDVVAVPLLVKKMPLPLRRMMGDLSSEDRVIFGLDLVPVAD